jgi:hypothetical protein
MASQAEREIEIQARVIALEYLVQQLLWIVITDRTDGKKGDSSDVIEEARSLGSNCLDELEGATLPGSDPATSDHATALVHENVERVFRELVAKMESRLGLHPSSPT